MAEYTCVRKTGGFNINTLVHSGAVKTLQRHYDPDFQHTDSFQQILIGRISKLRTDGQSSLDKLFRVCQATAAASNMVAGRKKREIAAINDLAREYIDHRPHNPDQPIYAFMQKQQAELAFNSGELRPLTPYVGIGIETKWDEKSNGAVITRIAADAPASRAGLSPGDIIIQVIAADGKTAFGSEIALITAMHAESEKEGKRGIQLLFQKLNSTAKLLTANPIERVLIHPKYMVQMDLKEPYMTAHKQKENAYQFISEIAESRDIYDVYKKYNTNINEDEVKIRGQAQMFIQRYPQGKIREKNDKRATPLPVLMTNDVTEIRRTAKAIFARKSPREVEEDKKSFAEKIARTTSQVGTKRI